MCDISSIAQWDFQIMSDLHLETPLARPTYEDFGATIIPRSPYLALLGDIGYAEDLRLFDFLEAQLHHFQIVFFLLGNHEAYGVSFPAAKAHVKAFAARMDERRRLSEDIGKFVFLDQTRYDLDKGLTVLGCTLFSRISKEQTDTVNMFVTDFSRIEKWQTHDHNNAHESDVNWLNAQVKSITDEEPERTIVIFTHHSPTLLEAAADPRHKNDSAQTTSAFATSLSNEVCWCAIQVRLWAFGHTHYNCDFDDPQTGKRLFTNQKGYRRTESLTFDAMKTVHVEQCRKHDTEEGAQKQDQGIPSSRVRHWHSPAARHIGRNNKCVIM